MYEKADTHHYREKFYRTLTTPEHTDTWTRILIQESSGDDGIRSNGHFDSCIDRLVCVPGSFLHPF